MENDLYFCCFENAVGSRSKVCIVRAKTEAEAQRIAESSVKNSLWVFQECYRISDVIDSSNIAWLN